MDEPGNLPNISFIAQKPEPLGTEMKSVCDSVTGILLFLEIQRGKDGMANMPFVNDMIKTAACTARLMQGSKLTYDNAATSDSEDS